MLLLGAKKTTLQFVLFSFQPLIFSCVLQPQRNELSTSATPPPAPVQQHHSALLDAADHKAQLDHRGVAACHAMYSDHPIW